ncbi:conjugal transfer protein, partial [Listeria monocytogenes]|nr:conjugal transfer protein [Listeria monocytogenes]
RPINTNLKFVELVNPVYTQNEKNVQVKVDVKYLDNLSKTMNYFQYELRLQKDGNWRIIKAE